ncbi:MAG: response regulator [Candidatus Omnitrophota bacterium]
MGRILIADDEEVIREVLDRILSRQGYEVETVCDGIAALNRIRNADFDMVITDLKMPNMDGMELIRNIKELNKDLLIIVITGYASVQTAKEAIKLGCYDYITKPFEVEDISIIVKRAIEARRLAVEKQRLKEHLVRAERLASLGCMAAGMAHELNTVFTSVKLFIEMLQGRIEEAGMEAKNFSVILDEIERAEKLIVRFLDFAKPQDIELRQAAISEIIEKSLEFLKYRFKKHNISITREFESPLPMIFCDPAKIEQVFLNLFINSIEAIAKGGELNIKANSFNGGVAIIISDTGNGIARENLDKVFEPFFTTKPSGWGLGLSIVHRIIDEHKGMISINSQKDKGAQVRIELPVFKSRE